MNDYLPLTVGIPLLAVCCTAVTDIWKFKVYNVVTIPLLVTGLAYHGVFGEPGAFARSLAGALFGFGVLFVFYLAGGMGAGDVKLMAGVGAWLGMPLTLYVFIASSLAAGLYGLVLICRFGFVGGVLNKFRIAWLRLVAIGRHLSAEDRVEQEVVRDDRRQRIIPFAGMIAVGFLGVLVWAWLGNGR